MNMNDSTRISDLPDMPSGQMQNSVQQNNWSQQQQQPQQNTMIDMSNTYQPMNVHANPYGNEIHTMDELKPYPREDRKKDSMQRLPSRDIPMNTNQFMDEEVRANYIPKPKNVSDYVRDYKEEESERIHKHKKEKNKRNKLDEIYTEFQELFLMAIIFFISQMSIVNKLMRQHLLFLGIYDLDGNINIRGMIFKSAIFSLVYGITFKAGNKLFPF
jgi:hypothetical protein